MGRKALKPEPGAIRPVKVKLSPELNVDLWAFCEVHHGSPHNRIIEKAVQAFIEADLERHPTLVPEWNALRESLQSKPQIVRFDKTQNGRATLADRACEKPDEGQD